MAGNALSHLERDRFSERSLFSVSLASTGSSKGSHPERKVQFFDIVQKAFDPPPPPRPHLFEHYVMNFSEGILTKERKRLSRQLSTK